MLISIGKLRVYQPQEMRTFNQVQYKSETKRVGEPQDHVLACDMIDLFFTSNLDLISGPSIKERYYVIRNWKQYFPVWFVSLHKLKYSIHQYDVAIFNAHNDKLELICEVLQTFTIIVTLPNGVKVKCTRSKHDHKKQMINDGVSKNWIEIKYPEVKYYTPEKSDCLDFEYLYDRFSVYIKGAITNYGR